MNKDILKKMMATHIAGLFPGASVSTGSGNDKQRKYVVLSKGQTQIRVKEINGESFFITRAKPSLIKSLKL